MFRKMKWKNKYGRWDHAEIEADILVISAIIIVIGCLSYLYVMV